MSRFSTVRWQMAQAVRELMLATPPEHPLRRAHAMVRTLPIVRQIWRAVLGGAEPTWMHPDKYAQSGGAFAISASPGNWNMVGRLPLHNEESFYRDLLMRIDSTIKRDTLASDTIVLINNGLSSGGAERQIVYTLTGLARRNYNPRFIGEYLDLAPGQSFYLPHLERAGVEAAQLQKSVRLPLQTFRHVPEPVAIALTQMPAQDVLDILDMADALRIIRPRLVHVWQDQTATKHTISSLIAGVPRILLSFRNLNPTHFDFHLPHMKAAYLAFSDHPAVHFSNNSQAGANSYAEWLGIPPERITVIRNAVDVDNWPDRSTEAASRWRKENGFRPDAPLVVGIFRLSREKRPLLWIDTAVEVRQRLPETQFALIGVGNMDRAVDEAIKRHGLSDAVKCLGEVKDVSLALKAADAFLLTSAQEGMPNVLLEAQWYGCPVVTTDAGGARETVEGGPLGTVAADDSPSALADMVIRAIAMSSRRSDLEPQSKAYIRSRFGLERMLDETLEAYETEMT